MRHPSLHPLPKPHTVALGILVSLCPTLLHAQSSDRLLKRTLEATVRISDYSPTHLATGSGAIVGVDYRGAYLITANHVIDPGQTLLIEVFRTDERRGTPIPGTIEILGRSRDADLAVLRIDRAPWLPQALQIRPSEDPVPIEGKAFVVGCANGKTPRLAQANMTGQVTAGSALFRTTDESPDQGQSGGPLVDDEGYLIGICSASRGTVGLFADVSEIRALFAKAGLSFLCGVPASGRTPFAAPPVATLRPRLKPAPFVPPATWSPPRPFAERPQPFMRPRRLPIKAAVLNDIRERIVTYEFVPTDLGELGVPERYDGGIVILGSHPVGRRRQTLDIGD